MKYHASPSPRASGEWNQQSQIVFPQNPKFEDHKLKIGKKKQCTNEQTNR
jgi:hypothetical protein